MAVPLAMQSMTRAAVLRYMPMLRVSPPVSSSCSSFHSTRKYLTPSLLRAFSSSPSATPGSSASPLSSYPLPPPISSPDEVSPAPCIRHTLSDPTSSARLCTSFPLSPPDVPYIPVFPPPSYSLPVRFIRRIMGYNHMREGTFLWEKACSQSVLPLFYSVFGVDPSFFNGQMYVIALHIWLIQRRIRGELAKRGLEVSLLTLPENSAAARSHRRSLQSDIAKWSKINKIINEWYWTIIDANVKQTTPAIKITKTTIGKQELIFGLYMALDVVMEVKETLMRSPERANEEYMKKVLANPAVNFNANATIEGILWRNVYAGNEQVHRQQVIGLKDYLMENMRMLEGMNTEQFECAEFNWVKQDANEWREHIEKNIAEEEKKNQGAGSEKDPFAAWRENILQYKPLLAVGRDQILKDPSVKKTDK